MLHVRTRAGRMRVPALRRCLIAALALPLLAGCGPGFVSATDRIVADNAAGRAGEMLARSVVLVKSTGAGQAALAGTLINNGDRPDSLTAVDITENVAGAPTLTLTPDVTLDPRELVAFGTEGTEPLTVPEAGDLTLGSFAKVVFRFRDSGAITLYAPIEGRNRFYSEVVPRTGGAATQADAVRRATSCKDAPTAAERRACRADRQRPAKDAAGPAGR